MEYLLLFIIILVFYIIFLKINKNVKLLKQDIKNLNNKIDEILNLVKEKNVSNISEKKSKFENLIPSEIKEKKLNLSQADISTPIKPLIDDKKNDIPKYENSPILKQKVKRKKSSFDLEKILGENILSKIGITTLILGIAYFVKYAIDRNWIEEKGRVGIGIIIGLIIISIAHKLRKKYLYFSGLLAGGGISVLYITVTIAFREYQLFFQNTAFIILIAITVGAVFLSIYYNHKIIAIFSILGGFASPLLVSSDNGNYSTLFSYILILNTGMLILAYKKKWIVVSVLSYIFTYLFYISWIVLSYTIKERNGAVIFGILFFIQFYVLVLIEYFKIRTINFFQVFIILSNNFLLYIVLFSLFEPAMQSLITLFMAVINCIPILLLIKIKEQKTLFFRLLIGIVISFISLTIPVKFNGEAITMFWGVEAVLLIWLFRKTQIEIFKYSFLLLQLLTLFALTIDYYKAYILSIEKFPIIINSIFITGILVIGYLCISLFILKKVKNTSIKIFQINICNICQLRMCLGGILLLLLFIIPFSELTYQICQYYPNNYGLYLIQGVYIYLFILIYILVKKYQLKKGFYYFFLILSVIYSIVYLRGIVFTYIENKTSDFLNSVYILHILTIPAFIILQNYLFKNSIFKNRDIIYWIIFSISILALSFEIDNIVLLFYSKSVLENVHTIVYSIIWGIIALLMIIIGIKQKKLIFRKISMFLFILIIFKLYLYDVWKMPQTGKIISFVLLGIILLTTSFLYQKLKVLVNNEKEEIKDEKNNLH